MLYWRDFLLTFLFTNSDLAKKIYADPTGTALQSPPNTDDVYHRLQMNANGTAWIFKSLPGGAGPWSGSRVITDADINLLSADGVQCDYANDTAYYKVMKNGIIHQLAFNKTGIHYHTWDGANWTLIWDK